MPAQRREVPAPVRATAPIIGFIFISSEGKDISDFPDCSKGDEIETCLSRQGLFAIGTRIVELTIQIGGWIEDILECAFTTV